MLILKKRNLILLRICLGIVSLKRIADKYDVHIAQKMSSNASIREIFRYTQPLEEEVHNYSEMLLRKVNIIYII